MDHTCNIGFNDGTYLALDGWDEISFYNNVPNIEKTYSGYDLQREQVVYYEALNNLNEYNFIGIRRKHPSDELEFAGKKFAFEHYYNEGKDVDQLNETLYLQTSAITTIAVYEQWNEDSKWEDERW
ncbi:hypothetical protein [Mammaliicoccus lentus]|uniref:hypothetical protein n=1 Tax=Mammaliicoccus lentus TaxID=42858 RepID=UPI002649A2DE|nr:hypothetical protein [Mammaliicoccus lentus]